MQLKDLPQDIMEDIIHERTKNGPFFSFQDFLNRTSPRIHLQDVRILIKAGCFDTIAYGIPRSGLMWQALEFFNHKEKKKAPTLFDETQAPTSLHRCISRQKPYPKNLMLKQESETLGFLLSVHPLDVYRNSLKNLNYVRAKDLHTKVGKKVTTIGWQITGKTVRTRDGDTMKFVSFEDPTGIYETVFFPQAYDKYCHMLNATRPYILKGKVEDSFGAITMTVNWIGFLDRYK
jgi:error-prone DNA polymerase